LLGCFVGREVGGIEVWIVGELEGCIVGLSVGRKDGCTEGKIDG